MKKLFILLSISLFMLAACCDSPKNADDATTKSETCCPDTKAEASCAVECKECPDTKKECTDKKCEDDCKDTKAKEAGCSTDDCKDCPEAKKDCPEAKK